MKRKQDYTPEFRAETVKTVVEQGLSLAKAVRKAMSMGAGAASQDSDND